MPCCQVDAAWAEPLPSQDGPWRHAALPWHARDGGHAMLFKDFGGRLHLALHAPNTSPLERPLFLPIVEHDDALVVEDEALGAFTASGARLKRST